MLDTCVTHVHACTMSVAAPEPRRAIPVQQRALDHEAYLEACRVKGATNQQQRAQLFGLPHQALSRYERGTVEPLVTTAAWIASRIDLSVEELWIAA